MQLDTVQKVSKLNEIYRNGESGPGGAYHEYEILNGETGEIIKTIKFQKGPRHDYYSKTGVLDQDLLEIVKDRLTSFCEGDMPTEETAEALKHVQLALEALNKRIEDRTERGVIGTYQE